MKISLSAVSFGAVWLALSFLGGASPSHRRDANPSLPLVEDKALQDSIKIDNLVKHAKALEDIAYSTPDRNRAVGSLGHNKTVEYLTGQLDLLGDYYTTEVQHWEGLVQANGSSTFTVNGQEYQSRVVEYSSNVTLTDLLLIPVANLGCDAADFPSAVSGNIALIFRGTCLFTVKATLAKNAGALGVVFYNNPTNKGVVAGTFGGVNDSTAPATGISQADGEALVAAYNGGTTLLASLSLTSVLRYVYSANVIATTKYGDENNVLFLGAHSDSVPEGPGINDDGSGSVGILETAIQLSKWETNAKVKFGWWTAEEAGILGSSAYVASLSDEELLKIRLYLNFDMIASPNFILGHYDGDGSEFNITGPAGSAEAEHFFEEYYESQGLNHTATPFTGRSDYRDFLASGVPCGGLDAGADDIKTQEWAEMFGGTAGITLDPNYHQPGDNFSNLNLFPFEIMSKGIAHAVAFYGSNVFEGFPVRVPPEKRSVETRAVSKPLSYDGLL